MKSIFTKAFWEYAGERAIKVASSTALGILGTGATGVMAVDWLNLVSAVGISTLVSILTSVVSAK